MATVYQIGSESNLIKDLVFGWVFTGEDVQIILSSANEAEVQYLLSVVPSTPLFTDVRDEMVKRLRTVQEANALEDECRSLAQEQQAAVESKRAASLAEEQVARDTRQAEINQLEDNMRVWFSGGLPTYEVKNRDTGYVYCNVTEVTHGYCLSDYRGKVVAVCKYLSEVAQTVANKWW